RPVPLILISPGRPPWKVPASRGNPVKGKVFVHASQSGGGIWNYTWSPTTPVSEGDLPESVTRFGTDVTTKIINPLLKSPVQGARKVRTRSHSSGLTPSPRRIQARERGE